jgi:anthranilate synthase component 2
VKILRVLVIDNYDSFVYNLVQYIGELGGEPVVQRNNQLTLKQAMQLDPQRIVISPGPGTPEDPHYFGICPRILREMSFKIPTLGICLGNQGIISVFGGKIVQAERLMHGKTSKIRHNEKGLFKGIKNPLIGTRYHSLVGEKTSIPSCIEITAESMDDHEIMAVRHKKYPISGLQFHPESILCEDGKKIIKNFLEGRNQK